MIEGLVFIRFTEHPEFEKSDQYFHMLSYACTSVSLASTFTSNGNHEVEEILSLGLYELSDILLEDGTRRWINKYMAESRYNRLCTWNAKAVYAITDRSGLNVIDGIILNEILPCEFKYTDTSDTNIVKANIKFKVNVDRSYGAKKTVEEYLRLNRELHTTDLTKSPLINMMKTFDPLLGKNLNNVVVSDYATKVPTTEDGYLGVKKSMAFFTDEIEGDSEDAEILK